MILNSDEKRLFKKQAKAMMDSSEDYSEPSSPEAATVPSQLWTGSCPEETTPVRVEVGEQPSSAASNAMDSLLDSLEVADTCPAMPGGAETRPPLSCESRPVFEPMQAILHREKNPEGDPWDPKGNHRLPRPHNCGPLIERIAHLVAHGCSDEVIQRLEHLKANSIERLARQAEKHPVAIERARPAVVCPTTTVDFLLCKGHLARPGELIEFTLGESKVWRFLTYEQLLEDMGYAPDASNIAQN